MALSRSAARGARHRRWLWALTACGGAAGLIALDGELQERAQEQGQTTIEYAQERATEAANSLRKTSGVAGALLRTATSSAMVAVQQRNFDPGPFRADLAATVADLVSETPTRRHLVALGGGYFLDWLLQLAYPPMEVPGSSPNDSGAVAGGKGGAGNSSSYALGSSSSSGSGTAGGDGSFGVALRPGGAPAAADDDGSRFGGLSPWSAPADEGRREVVARQVAALGSSAASASDAAECLSAAATTAATAAAARLCREAERALESILVDDVAAALLLERPGAVPLLLHAVADGRAGGGVAEALAARAAEARLAAEAMTADLQAAVEVLRGRSSATGGGGGGGALALQCTAAGLLAAAAAGSGANRAKLTGLGLQDVVAEVATAVSGLSDRAAVGLQWELLRLTRVMAEHSSVSDSHHLAVCVLPLLYTAADAAAAEDAAMASYAVDTLAAAVRHGGAPVAEVVSSSTMPHLLWQLAEAMGAHRVLAAPPADGKDTAAAAAGAAAGAVPGSAQQAAAAKAATAAKAKVSRGWLSGRSGDSAAAAGRQSSSAAAASAGAVGGGGSGAATSTSTSAAAPVKSRKVLRVQDPAVAASVAAAVAELARYSLLPEEQMPRWRDWLLDVLCSDGFEPGTSAGAGATSAAAGGPGVWERTQGAPPLSRRRPDWRLPAAPGARGGISGTDISAVRVESGEEQQQQQQRLPAWLTLPEGAGRRRSGAGGGGGDGGATPAADRVSERRQERRRGMDTVRGSVVAALAALSHMPGNQGLQAAHYWLSRLLSELAARTLPYTSLVYLEGPRAPQDLIHVVPVLPSYVKSVADALERAADAVADDSPPLPPHLEFDLAGSGLVARPMYDAPEPRRPAGTSSSKLKGGGGRPGTAAGGAAAAMEPPPQQQQQLWDPQQAAADVAAYRQAAHVVDVVVAERKAADALEALCAIVAPDSDKQRWLLQRGVLPLLHRLTRTADDPRVVLQEQGQPGAECIEREAAAAAGALELESPQQLESRTPRQHHQQQHHHQYVALQHPRQTQQHQGQGHAPAVVPELMSDHEGGPSLCLQRQVARMLALLALLQDARHHIGGGSSGSGGGGGGWAAAPVLSPSHPQQPSGLEEDGGGGVRVSVSGVSVSGGGGWLPWLHHAATSSDCRLSSNATRALLHMAALDAAAAAAAASAAAVAGDTGGCCGLSVAIPLPPLPPPPPPVFFDGIHLLDPGAPHHWALIQPLTATPATEAVSLTAGATTAAAVAATVIPGEAAAAADHDGDSRPAELRLLPTGTGAPGAAVAASMAPAAPLPPAELAALPAGVHRDFAAAGGGGSATGVTLGCSAAGGSGGVVVAPSVAAAALGTLRFLFSRTQWLWGSTALAAGYGRIDDAALPPQTVVVAAATAAEPLQASPRGAEPRRPSRRPSNTAGADASEGSDALADGGGGNSKAGSGAVGGAPIPASAIPPYPAPYLDLAITDSSAAAGPPGDTSSTQPHAESADGGAAAAAPPPPPVVDVVFVHGIRGGPFITWRKAGVMTRGSAASHMERSACWPSTWLAEDLPGARLLSVEYLAPVSAWEGESLPLEDNVSRVMGQLAAAGVGTGQRPVVFVAHSMGGLLVKEMLARSMDQAAAGGGPNAPLAASTCGIVFFGTPHFGNALAAMGWKLRYVPGALPAPSLARLTPGPHLLSLNDRLRQLHDAQPGALRVVSLMEGRPTQLSGVIPRILIVAPDSAYPGFGAALTLPNNDHIDCCKPAGRADPAYSVVRDLVVHAMRVAAPGGG